MAPIPVVICWIFPSPYQSTCQSPYRSPHWSPCQHPWSAPQSLNNITSKRIINYQSLIRKVFSRYLHSLGSHQSTWFLELWTDSLTLSLLERLVTLKMDLTSVDNAVDKPIRMMLDEREVTRSGTGEGSTCWSSVASKQAKAKSRRCIWRYIWDREAIKHPSFSAYNWKRPTEIMKRFC